MRRRMNWHAAAEMAMAAWNDETNSIIHLAKGAGLRDPRGRIPG
jgi:hypothetical protein